jgi:hypothetical protein
VTRAPPPREPDRGLAGGVAAADDGNAGCAAELCLRRPGCIERADALVVGEIGERQPPVLGTGCENDSPGGDFVPSLELHHVPPVVDPERSRAIGRRRPSAELACLRHGPARQLDAAEPGREAEVVLDPSGGSGLAAESSALDHERVEPLRRAVYGSRQARRAGAHHEQVDLLAGLELPAHAERPQNVARGGPLQLCAAREPDQRRFLPTGGRLVVPRVGQVVGPGELEQPSRRFGRARPHDLEADSLNLLEGLAPGDEGREQEIAELAVLEQQIPEGDAVDLDIAHRLCHDRGQEHGLAGEQVELAEKLGRAAADDLVAGAVEHRHLALLDGDEGIGRVAQPEQHVADGRRPSLSHFREPRQLRGRQRGVGAGGHEPSLLTPGHATVGP